MYVHVSILYVLCTCTDSDSGGLSEEEVIRNTLHSCHNDLNNKLNLPLVYSRLNQEGVLSANSVPIIMRPLPPDNAGAQINNLYLELHRCSLDEFDRFIDIVIDTADEGGEAHEELGRSLRENFSRFKSSKGPSEITVGYG